VVDSGYLHLVVGRLVDLCPSHRPEQPGMGAHDRGHVPGLERLELKPAGAIASLDRHQVISRLWLREIRRQGWRPRGPIRRPAGLRLNYSGRK
jgi:hypothetical protein